MTDETVCQECKGSGKLKKSLELVMFKKCSGKKK